MALLLELVMRWLKRLWYGKSEADLRATFQAREAILRRDLENMCARYHAMLDERNRLQAQLDAKPVTTRKPRRT